MHKTAPLAPRREPLLVIIDMLTVNGVPREYDWTVSGTSSITDRAWPAVGDHNVGICDSGPHLVGAHESRAVGVGRWSGLAKLNEDPITGERQRS